jgi:cytoskeletal protein RodZ
MLESIGKFFKDARREKGLSIGEVCKRTKISHNVISAIEEDNLEILSPIYMKSFLRLYAQFLNLDVAKILTLYSEYTGTTIPKEEIRPPVTIAPLPQPEGQPNLFRGVLNLAKKGKNLAIVIAAVLILFLIASSCRAIIKKINSSRKAVAVGQQLEEQEGSEKAQDKLKEQPLSELEQADYLHLSIKAKLDCWMRVKVDDKLIFSGTLKKGAVESWQAEDKIEIKLGNPSGVDIELNNRLLEQFGKRTAKARSVIITRQGIKLGQ